MPRLKDDSYDILDSYVRAVLRRHGIIEERAGEAVEDLMHPLTALIDHGEGSQEFVPYMKMMLSQWKAK